MAIRLNPKPKKAKKNRGKANAPIIRDLALLKRFISRSHKTKMAALWITVFFPFSPA
jgi:hypothetical protein